MGEFSMNTTRVDYVDSDGIKRRVLLPSDDGLDPAEGIPVSVPVDALFEHMPVAFRRALVDALWNNGLIESVDFLRKDAPDKIRASLLSVVKHDTMDILNLAREMKNG
jgi:hypothetical protein